MNSMVHPAAVSGRLTSFAMNAREWRETIGRRARCLSSISDATQTIKEMVLASAWALEYSTIVEIDSRTIRDALPRGMHADTPFHCIAKLKSRPSPTEWPMREPVREEYVLQDLEGQWYILLANLSLKTESYEGKALPYVRRVKTERIELKRIDGDLYAFIRKEPDFGARLIAYLSQPTI